MGHDLNLPENVTHFLLLKTSYLLSGKLSLLFNRLLLSRSICVNTAWSAVSARLQILSIYGSSICNWNQFNWLTINVLPFHNVFSQPLNAYRGSMMMLCHNS